MQAQSAVAGTVTGTLGRLRLQRRVNRIKTDCAETDLVELFESISKRRSFFEISFGGVRTCGRTQREQHRQIDALKAGKAQ